MRTAVRRVRESGEALAAVRIRGGRELAVVDVSDAGALVEGPTRLLPGRHVEVHVVTAEGRVRVRTRIVRAFVSALRDGVLYVPARWRQFQREVKFSATQRMARAASCSWSSDSPYRARARPCRAIVSANSRSSPVPWCACSARNSSRGPSQFASDTLSVMHSWPIGVPHVLAYRRSDSFAIEEDPRQLGFDRRDQRR